MNNREQFSVKGMTCGNCVKHVQKALQGLQGISQAEVDLHLQQATVEYDPQAITYEHMAMALKEAGYDLEKMET